jgi:hypothetical protein
MVFPLWGACKKASDPKRTITSSSMVNNERRDELARQNDAPRASPTKSSALADARMRAEVF